jgi:hypothetical protein
MRAQGQSRWQPAAARAAAASTAPRCQPAASMLPPGVPVHLPRPDTRSWPGVVGGQLSRAHESSRLCAGHEAWQLRRHSACLQRRGRGAHCAASSPVSRTSRRQYSRRLCAAGPQLHGSMEQLRQPCTAHNLEAAVHLQRYTVEAMLHECAARLKNGCTAWRPKLPSPNSLAIIIASSIRQPAFVLDAQDCGLVMLRHHTRGSGAEQAGKKAVFDDACQPNECPCIG